MQIKEKIIELIKTNTAFSKDKEGSFANVVVPAIENAADNEILITVINMLYSQCEIYDILLDNISKFGNQELIKKCKEDITVIFKLEE